MVTVLAGAAVAAAVLLWSEPSPHPRVRSLLVAGRPGAATPSPGPVHAAAPPRRSAAVAGAVLVAALGLGLDGPVLAILLGTGAALGWRARSRRLAGRRAAAEVQSAGLLLQAVEAELEAGASAEQALERAGASSSDPAWGRWTAVLLAQAATDAEPGRRVRRSSPGGAAPRSAVSPAAAQPLPTGSLRALGCALEVSRSTGAALAVVVSRAAAAAQAEQAGQRELATELAGSRGSAQILLLLPLLGLGLAATTGSSPVHFLLHTAPGIGCLLLGLTLQAAGAGWTSVLVRRVEAL